MGVTPRKKDQVARSQKGNKKTLVKPYYENDGGSFNSSSMDVMGEIVWQVMEMPVFHRH